MFVQNLITAFEQVFANKLRSLLTVLGVVIAVMSTIIVVSVISGFSRYVTTFLEGLGSNIMWVIPQRALDEQTSVPAEMDLGDIEEVSELCSAVERVAPMTGGDKKIKFLGRETEAPIIASTREYLALRNLEVDVGRCFGPVDIESRHAVCVVGREVLDRLGADDGAVGEYLSIGGQRFLVIGLLARKGRLLGEKLDDLVLIPYTTFLKRNPIYRHFLAFIAQATSAENVAEAQAQITSVLRRRHKLGPESANDFTIQTQEEILKGFRRVQWIAATVLVSIVGISLLVGGIGIMNVMLVSVTERTREIGLRKAVGARRRDILAQFLTEAAVLCGLGGVIGVVLGYAVTSIASMHPDMIDVSVPLWAALLGVGFSAFVGVIFGLLPAMKAAIIPPIEALRYE